MLDLLGERSNSTLGADVDPNPTPPGSVLNLTDEQRAEIVRRYRLYSYQPDPGTGDHPLALISPASEKTISSTLGELRTRPATMLMHPDDAAARGLSDGDAVRVYNALGEVHCFVEVSDAIREQMLKNERVTVITAAMCQGNKLERIRDEIPARFFDTGICESYAVAFAAGQAKAGLRPVVDIYSTFLQRSYDQGKYQEAARAAAEFIEARWRAGFFPAGLPVYYTMAGQPDKLLEFYEWGLEQHLATLPGGVREGGRAFPQLESNPRYQAILRRIGLP